MDTADFLRHIQSLLWYQEQIVHVEQVPSREARTRDLDPPLDSRLVQRLEDLGVSGLYTHQAEAIEKLRDGKNVIVATPAASGKSMCYNLPVLEWLLEDRTARALYLYPTKALSQDQEKKLAELMPASEGPRGIRHAIFDGDTPRPDRATIRRSSNIVITNPDMLHLGILPNHRAWYRTLRGLKYVVLDEAHVYRGVFGTHVANVLRTAQAAVPSGWKQSAVHTLLGNDSQSRRTRGEAGRAAVRGGGGRRLALRRQGLRALESTD